MRKGNTNRVHLLAAHPGHIHTFTRHDGDGEVGCHFSDAFFCEHNVDVPALDEVDGVSPPCRPRDPRHLRCGIVFDRVMAQRHLASKKCLYFAEAGELVWGEVASVASCILENYCLSETYST